MDTQTEFNPYAPPARLEVHEEYAEGGVFQDAGRLRIRAGAALPPRCFATGVDTTESFQVVQQWQPRWVYLLLLPGVLPFYFVSPYYTRRVALKVPLARSLLEAHRRTVNVGFFLLTLFLLSVLVSVAAFLFPSHVFRPFWIPLFPTILLGEVGFFLSSGTPVRLAIDHLDEEWLVLRVHPRCLEGLPHWSDAVRR